MNSPATLMTDNGCTTELARHLSEASLDGVCVFDRELRYVYWNGVMEEIFGLPAREVIGRCGLDLFPFLATSGDAELMQEALSGRRSAQIDTAYSVPRTGKNGFIESHYSPLVNGHGKIDGGIGVVRDITARKRAEAQLYETETRFRRMADSSPVLLWMSGTHALCTFFNQTWLDFTGRTMEQELGEGWAEGVHPFDFQRCMDTYVEHFNARKPFEMEYRLRRADGEYRWVLDRGAPRYDADGVFAGFIGSCTDITERKNAEAEMQGALDKAEEASRVKSEFLANISHELRTPLNAIVNVPLALLRDFPIRPVWRCPKCGMAFEKRENSKPKETGAEEAFAMDDACPECAVVMTWSDEPVYSGNPTKTAHFLQRLVHSSQHLLTMVSDLLNFAKFDAGQMRLFLAGVDIASVFSEVLLTVGPLAEEKGVGIRFQEFQAPMTLLADGVKLTQILINLVGNAIKFTDAGGSIHVGAAIEVEKGREHVCFRVEDTGIGIPEDKQEAIFESFRQVDGSHTRAHQGTGLGLTIARQLVELHGGRIWVESRVGQGSVFNFVIPKNAAHPKPPEEGALAPRPRVLVIDDNPTDLDLARSILEEAGCEVMLIDHPALALRMVQEVRPDCIILDILMPELSGLTLLRQIKQSTDTRGIPVLVSTAYQSNRELVERFGGVWAPKPWSGDELAALVQRQSGSVKNGETQ